MRGFGPLPVNLSISNLCRAFDAYNQTCTESEQTSGASSQCSTYLMSGFWRDTLEQECANAWGNLLGVPEMNMGVLSQLSNSIVDACEELTTEVRFVLGLFIFM